MSRVVHIDSRVPPALDAPESEIVEFAHGLIAAGYEAFKRGEHARSLDLLKKGREAWKRTTKWNVCRQPIEILIDAVEHKLEQLAVRGTRH